MLLTMLSEGRLHLSGIERLAPHLTEENRDEVLARAAFQSKRQIEELVAELAPKPDVPATIRKLPTPAAPTSTQPTPTPLLRSDGAKTPAAPRPQPLAPERYKVQFTATRELRDKLERLQSLMGDDLSSVIEAAVTEKLERLEAKRYAEVKKPRKGLGETDTSPRTRYIPAAVKRAVRKRDGNRCRFVDKSGRRCTECHGLEFHHHDPYGRGGDHHPSNLSLYCKRHNAHSAERDFGKEVMQRYRRNVDRVLETGSPYGLVSPFHAARRAARVDPPRHLDTSSSTDFQYSRARAFPSSGPSIQPALFRV
jgi:hypothetical protein